MIYDGQYDGRAMDIFQVVSSVIHLSGCNEQVEQQQLFLDQFRAQGGRVHQIQGLDVQNGGFGAQELERTPSSHETMASARLKTSQSNFFGPSPPDSQPRRKSSTGGTTRLKRSYLSDEGDTDSSDSDDSVAERRKKKQRTALPPVPLEK